MEVTSYLDNDKLLVVGGTGFIGSAVAREALKRGFQVSIISNNKCPLSEQLINVEYIVVDIVDKRSLLLKLKGINFDHVINLGGYVDHVNYSDGGKKVIESHFNGIKNIVNSINKAYLKSFVQIGTSDEYGDNSAPQNESQREMPISPYSFAKTASTHFLQMLYRTEGFPVVILRPFLVYGPGQNQNRLIPHVIKGCLNNDVFPVSSGNQLRDFCYISDIVNAILASVGNNNAYGEVINIASGAAIPIKQIIVMVRDIIGSGNPKFGKIERRMGENIVLYADISKAKKILNWCPKVNLKEGLIKTISSTIESTEKRSI